MKMNDRHRNFATLVVRGLTPPQAYMKAYNKDESNQTNVKSAHVLAYKLIHRPEVEAEITRVRNEAYLPTAGVFKNLEPLAMTRLEKMLNDSETTDAGVLGAIREILGRTAPVTKTTKRVTVKLSPAEEARRAQVLESDV